MKWTTRDTAYLAVTLLLVTLLGVLLFKDLRSQDASRTDRYQRVELEGGALYPSEGGTGMNRTEVKLHRTPSPGTARTQSRIIRITPGMTRAEIAEALGMQPDELPPNVGVDAE